MSNQKIIERIKKLLRLAARSTSEGEAANALSQAQKLMAQHGLKDSAPELSDVSEAFVKSKSQAVTLPVYLHRLIGMISSAFGCKPVRTQDAQYQLGLTFIGHDERPDIAKYAYEVLERQLAKARKEYLKTQSKRLKKSTKVARADLFCGAWVMAVHEKIQALALTDEESTQITEYMHSMHPDLQTTKARDVSLAKARGGDMAAINAGYKAGQDVNLNHGVNGRETEKLTQQ
ncbi:DUF2786 domain-containing protein [Vibrio paucivorans]